MQKTKQTEHAFVQSIYSNKTFVWHTQKDVFVVLEVILLNDVDLSNDENADVPVKNASLRLVYQNLIP